MVKIKTVRLDNEIYMSVPDLANYLDESADRGYQTDDSFNKFLGRMLRETLQEFAAAFRKMAIEADARAVSLTYVPRRSQS
jgi:hypothetical protein